MTSVLEAGRVTGEAAGFLTTQDLSSRDLEKIADRIPGMTVKYPPKESPSLRFRDGVSSSVQIGLGEKTQITLVDSGASLNLRNPLRVEITETEVAFISDAVQNEETPDAPENQLDRVVFRATGGYEIRKRTS